jgi:microcystin-dependent protein
LFSIVSTTFGSGDGSTTFNLPDVRGRVIAGLDNMGGSSAARLSTAMTSTSMGNTGGAQQVALNTNNLPAYTPQGSFTGTLQVGVGYNGAANDSIAATGAQHVMGDLVTYGTGTLGNVVFNINQNTFAFAGNAQGGSSLPFNSIPPTMVANFILRII